LLRKSTVEDQFDKITVLRGALKTTRNEGITLFLVHFHVPLFFAILPNAPLAAAVRALVDFICEFRYHV